MRDPAGAAEAAWSAQAQLPLDAQPAVPLAPEALSAEQLDVVSRHSFDTTMVVERDGTVRYTNPSIVGTRGAADAFTFGPDGLDRIHPDAVPNAPHPFPPCPATPALHPPHHFPPPP